MHSLTHPRLREIAGYLDAVRGQLTATVDASPRAAFTVIPSDGRWSGAQIVQHLGKVEGATTKLLEGLFSAALASGLPADPDSASLLRSLDRFQSNGEVLGPLVAPERLRPTADAELDPVWASLVAIRARTYRAFGTVDGRNLAAITAPHPLLGPLNAYEWMLFLGKHEERHVGQLKRQLAAAA